MGRHVNVHVNGHPLAIHPQYCNHSVSFEWGYYGSGPSQLSWELLYRWFSKFLLPRVPFRKNDKARAVELADKYHQRFKVAIIARIPMDSTVWTLKFTNFFYFLLGETHDVWYKSYRRLG